MCGIAGIHVKNGSVGRGKFPIERLVDGLLLEIENRGRDATGYVAVTKEGEVTLNKNDVPATYFVQMRDFLPPDTKTVLLHTRLATKGAPKNNENNHPVRYGNCYVIHNGHIRNDDRVFEVLEYDRPAEVDSIAIPALVSYCGFDKAHEYLPNLQGNWAVAVIDPQNNPGELLLAKGPWSPLCYIDTPHFLMWASTVWAMRQTWEKNWGTAPDYSKFGDLKEGEYIHIDGEDNLTFGEMYEDPTKVRNRNMAVSGYTVSWSNGNGYGHGRGNAWTRDYRGDADHPSIGGATAPPVPLTSRRYTGDTTNCVECGVRGATVCIRDSYIDRNVVTSWDVPLCEECDTEIGHDPDKLKYEHNTDGIKLNLNTRVIPKAYEDGLCGLCRFFPGVTIDDTWGTLCRGCKVQEDEQKIVSSITGDDPNSDTILSLEEGDHIPVDVRYAFGLCEDCGDASVAFIGYEGMPVCAPCMGDQRTKWDANKPEGEQLCDGCMTRVPASQVTADTLFGDICKECAEIALEEGTCESDSGASIQDDPRQGRCSVCQHFLPKDNRYFSPRMEQVCEKCFDGIWDEKVDIDSSEVEDTAPLASWLSHAETRMALKFRAARETGWELNVPGGFVLWLLDEVTPDELGDPALFEIHQEALRKFGDNLDLIETLVDNGRQDLLETVPLSDEASAIREALS